MDQTPAQAPDIDVDVAVVGGGPAGLTTALALKRACPDIKVHVLERARKLRPAGGSIAFFSPEALAELLAPVGADVAQAIRDAGVLRSRFTARDIHGNAYIDNVGQENRAGFQIAWFDMQQALLPFLAQDEFSTGSGVTQVRQQDSGMMEIDLVNGKTVTAKLVVGADGNQSAVRSAYVCPDRRPFYVGATVWRFWLPLVNPHVEAAAYVTYSHQGKTFVMTNTAREGSASYASVLTTFPEDRLEELNQTRYIQAAEESSSALQARIARCRAAVGDTFPQELIDFVLDNAEPDGTLEHPMMALDPDFTWRRGMATLVGDAAHVMPPNFGQGTPMAMKDAVQLAASVRRHGLCPEALDEYERVQKEHLMPIWEGSAYSALYWYRDKIEEYDPFKLWGGGNKFTKAVDAALASYSPPALV